jgi:hypothetical protein
MVVTSLVVIHGKYNSARRPDADRISIGHPPECPYTMLHACIYQGRPQVPDARCCVRTINMM